LWGASFPLALAAVGREEKDPARLVGTVYAANTIGGIIGALFGSLARHRMARDARRAAHSHRRRRD
jgi:membrane protein YqaA with SNARE-associated domain